MQYCSCFVQICFIECQYNQMASTVRPQQSPLVCGASLLFLLASICCVRTTAADKVPVLSNRFDEYNNNANTRETLLTANSVTSAAGFNEKWVTPTDGGTAFAGVLFVPDVMVAGAMRDTVYIATNRNNVYALDAHTGDVLWSTAVQVALYGGVIGPLPTVDTTGSGADTWGVTSTPFIDQVTGVMYVVSTVKESQIPGSGLAHFTYQLFKLDILTGAIINSVVIAEETATCAVPGAMCTPVDFPSGPTIPGSVATDAIDGTLHFQVLRQIQRCGLNVVQGNVMIMFAGYGAIAPYHGWVLGYDAVTLAQTVSFCSEPNNEKGGIWGAGGKMAADSDGYMYAVTGNGQFNDLPANMDGDGFPIDGTYGTAVLKLAFAPEITAADGAINGWGMRVADYYSPWNSVALSDADLDLGSTGVLLIPDGAVPAHPKLLVTVGKDQTFYVIDRTNMGKFKGVEEEDLTFRMNLAATSSTGARATALSGTTYFNRHIYQVFSNGPGHQLRLEDDGTLTDVATASNGIAFGYTTGMPFLTANNLANALLWSTSSAIAAGNAGNPATANCLRVYSAANFALIREMPVEHKISKFSTPTVTNGVVYFATSTGHVHAWTAPFTNDAGDTPDAAATRSMNRAGIIGGSIAGGVAALALLAVVIAAAVHHSHKRRAQAATGKGATVPNSSSTAASGEAPHGVTVHGA